MGGDGDLKHSTGHGQAPTKGNEPPLPIVRMARASGPDGAATAARAVSEFAGVPAWVLIADPGAGKTNVFKTLSHDEGGEYVAALDFLDLNPQVPYREPLFIDGLDEVSASGASGSTVLGKIRTKLQAIGILRFRISCREADWRGNADSELLRRWVGSEYFTELHLAPLDREQSAALIGHWQGCDESVATAFIREAESRDLDGLLDNPQTLRMLVKAVAGSADGWPESKAQAYHLACTQLIHEFNDQHLAEQSVHAPPDDRLLKAAGHLCAVMLLSGSSGIRMRRKTETPGGIVCVDELLESASGISKEDIWAALRTRLFRGQGDGDFQPVHRTIAEFLAANHLVACIHDGLPARRALALMIGDDGGVVPALRGLHGWMAARAAGSLRHDLIQRDPLGVVLYGDVRDFSRQDKLQLLQSLRDEATRYTYFRSDNWVGNPFGALGTNDMSEDFNRLLTSSDRSPPHLALLDCVIDSIRYGQPMPQLDSALERLVRDPSYWSGLREKALKVLVAHAGLLDQWSVLLKLLRDVHDHAIEDVDNQLLGTLLSALYPGHLSPSGLWRHFQDRRAVGLIGNYYMFWHYLAKRNPESADIPALLDALHVSGRRIANLRSDGDLAQVVGDLLVWAVEHHGHDIDIPRLYRWLSLGLGPHDHCPLDNGQKASLASWLGQHPDRYKALFEHGLEVLGGASKVSSYADLCKIWQRLYGAKEPADASSWYAGLARSLTDQRMRLELVMHGFHLLDRTLGPDAALQLIERWGSEFPSDAEGLGVFLTCQYPPTESEQERIDADLRYKRRKELEARKTTEFFRGALATFPAGPAHLGALAVVAETYLRHDNESTEEQARLRLSNLLNHDPSWVALAYEGLRQALFRDDLPSACEVIKLHLRESRCNLTFPCLAAMNLRQTEDPAAALALAPSILETVAAMRLTHEYGETPIWFAHLVSSRPEVVAKVMQPLIRLQLLAGHEYPDGLHSLARDATYAEVARALVPDLVTEFPVKATKKQRSSLRLMITSLLRFTDRAQLLKTVAEKVDAHDMDLTQRAYWLTAGMLVDPDEYLHPFRQFVGSTSTHVGHMFTLLHEVAHWNRERTVNGVATQTCLIELMGPRVKPLEWRGSGGAHIVTRQMEMSEMVGRLISALASDPDDSATSALANLRQRADMKAWCEPLDRAIHEQNIARRKALFRPASVSQVCQTLANLKPASAADLWALTVEHLNSIVQEIRHGNTNDYGQYWDGAQPKIEDDCRDALLSDLKRQLASIGITAEPEGRYADQKRADIKVLFPPHNIAVEIKRESHRDLWTAIPKQLIAKYTREQASDGHGIFLAFWFTGKFGASPTEGLDPPQTPQELQSRLTASVPEALRHKIAVLVVDCSRPKKPGKPRRKAR